jgi:hypothetical protein
MWLELRDIRTGSVNPLKADRIIAGMTLRAVALRLKRRHYQWGKPIGEIAQEVGVRPDVISNTMRGIPPSDHAGYLIVGYLKTPAGPGALINNRTVKAESLARKRLAKKVRALRKFAMDQGLRVRKWTRVSELTNELMQAYYWNLDAYCKRALAEKYPDLVERYMMPDWWEPWQWLERLEALQSHRRQGPSTRTASG